MKTITMIWILLHLAAASAMALEACNRYDDNVDECYENYYRNASNYNYVRHRDCRMIDDYRQCGGSEKVPTRIERIVQPFNFRCRYNGYTDRVVCDDPQLRLSW